MARLKPCRCYKAHEQALLDFAWNVAGAKARGSFGERYGPAEAVPLLQSRRESACAAQGILGKVE